MVVYIGVMERTLQILVASIKLGINSRQLAIMIFVSVSPEKKVDYGDIVKHVVMKKPTATNALEELEGMGFVKRERQSLNRSKRFVILTPAGRAFVKSLEAA
jgi:DNA-binding MarR family transcriptional regulator